MLICPALRICAPYTKSWVPGLKSSALPLASCRLATLALRSSVTALLPSVMQTLVPELLGTPLLQLPALFQLLLEPWAQVSGELSVHCAIAAGWPRVKTNEPNNRRVTRLTAGVK